jgi:signal peptidase I
MPKTGWLQRRRERIAARRARPLRQRLVREWLVPITIIALVMTPVRASLIDWNDVPSGSMRPTIVEGDRIVVDKLAYGLRVPLTTRWVARWGEPGRGEVVVFASPLDGTRTVKRVVGLPGDRLSMRDNVLWLNGRAAELADAAPGGPATLIPGWPAPVRLASETIDGVAHGVALAPARLRFVGDFDELVVPEGVVFVLGDNRDASTDSRVIGFVPISHVYGRATHVALSIDYARGLSPRWERFFTPMR